MDRPSTTRAFFYLIWLSLQRQARAHLMVWIALGLLALSLLIVFINTQTGQFSRGYWRTPQGREHQARLEALRGVSSMPSEPGVNAGALAMHGAIRAAIQTRGGFFVFSEWIVFRLFATFLLPIWVIAFATEGLGREREANNLLWVLTRPIPRPAIFVAKYLALLPWCLLLNVGGFALLCLAGGRNGWLAFELYWPAAFWATLAFSALFHLMGACLRRAAIVALLYTFFIETIMGNMPGQFKRFSISYYLQCLMFDRAQDFGIQPERPGIFLPVSGTTAMLVLAGVTASCLVIGALVFTRNEYLDVN